MATSSLLECSSFKLKLAFPLPLSLPRPLPSIPFLIPFKPSNFSHNLVAKCQSSPKDEHLATSSNVKANPFENDHNSIGKALEALRRPAIAAFMLASGLLWDRDEGGALTVKSRVLKLQVRSLQKDLNRVAEVAELLSFVLTETLLALYQQPDYCIAGYSYVDVKQSLKDGEKRFNQLLIKERGNFTRLSTNLSKHKNSAPKPFILHSIDVSKEDKSPTLDQPENPPTSPEESPPTEGEEPQLDPRRLQEKFAVLNTGIYECRSCGYKYDESVGDPDYPIPPGLQFDKLPEDWRCPTCGAAKGFFESKSVEIAGFAENQQFGLGGNSLTSGQKALLIYGTLFFFFALFLSGYFLQ